MTFTSRLSDAINSVCPIHGVSVGRKSDKSTWRIDFKNEATTAQREAALAVLANFDAQKEEERISLLSQLQVIDSKTGSVRWVRELALGFKELHEILVSSGTQLPALGSGMAKVQAIEEQCKALRQKLSQL